MESESSIFVVSGVHPCYEMNNVSETLTITHSTGCVLLYIFLGLLSVVTACGNLLVIISIIYFKQLHTPSKCLIISLAVTDLRVGTVVFPFIMSNPLTFCLYYRNLFCKIRDSFNVLLSTNSTFTFFLCYSSQLTGGVTMQVYEILNWFTLSNSLLNPFIYAFFYMWFRSAFKLIISGKIFQVDFF